MDAANGCSTSDSTLPLKGQANVTPSRPTIIKPSFLWFGLLLLFVVLLIVTALWYFDSTGNRFSPGFHSSSSPDLLRAGPFRPPGDAQQTSETDSAELQIPQGKLESFPSVSEDGALPQKDEQIKDDMQVNTYDLSELLPKNYSSPFNIVEPTAHTPKNPPFTIVTAASSNHFCPLHAWVYTLKDRLQSATFHGDRPLVIVYDLGLVDWQRTVFKGLREAGYIDEFRRFNFGAYPAFFDVTVGAGEYAWKPTIIAEVANEHPGLIFWLDSGSFAESNLLSNAQKAADDDGGLLVAVSGGSFFEWTHPNLFDFYDDDDPERFADIRNCNAAPVLIDFRRVPHIIYEWARCARVRECIAPPGSSRQNHRQDQAALTYILANSGYFCNKREVSIGTVSHQDKHCDDRIRKYEVNPRPYSFSAREKRDVLRYKTRQHGRFGLSMKDLWLPGL